MTDEDREPHNPYSYPGLHSDQKQAPPSASTTKPVETGAPWPPGSSWESSLQPSPRAASTQAGDEWAEPKTHWAIETDQDLACELETLPVVVFVRDRWNGRIVASLPTRSLPYQIRVHLVCDHVGRSTNLDFEWCDETGAVAYRGVFTGLFLDWTGNKIKPGDPVGGPDDPWT